MQKHEHKISYSLFRASITKEDLNGELIDKYTIKYPICEIEIYIIDRNGEPYYLVNEPILNDNEGRLYNVILDKLTYIAKPTRNIDPLTYLNDTIELISENLGIKKDINRCKNKLLYFLYRDIFGYERIDVLIRDENVEEISYVNYHSPISIIHRKHSQYEWMKTNIYFFNTEDQDRFIRRLAQLCGKAVSTAYPIVDAISSEGHRIAITFQDEITLPGSTFTIRKFLKEPLTITKIIKYNTISPLMAAYLWLLLEAKGYIMIIGAMASGKTTLLSCLTNLINPNWKICTIEDTPEIITFHEQWLRMKTRKPMFKTDTKPIDLIDLVIISLRHRPDFIIVGETRGVEIQALTQAAGLGHGCLTTFHGGDPIEALTRMASEPLNVKLAGQLLIWAIVTMRRLVSRGKVIRRVASIDEIHPTEYHNEKPKLVRIFEWNMSDDTFTPNDPHEVVKRSVRLREVMKFMGWNTDKLIKELEERELFLNKLVSRGVFRYSDVIREFKKFYIMKKNE